MEHVHCTELLSKTLEHGRGHPARNSCEQLTAYFEYLKDLLFQGSVLMPDVRFPSLLWQWTSQKLPRIRNMINETTVPVVSDPVPAVVGIAMSGDNCFWIGSPFPKGAFTKSRNSASG